MKDPFEDSIENTLKSSGEAESLCVHDLNTAIHFVDQPIFCKPAKNLPYAFLGLEELKRAKVNSAYEGLVIVQPEDQSLPEFFASLKENHDDVVTLDDLAYESIDRAKNTIVSDYDWKHVAEECAQNGALFDLADADDKHRSWWLIRMVKEFITAQDAELIRHVVERHDPDFTLRILGSAFLGFYSRPHEHLQRAGLTVDERKVPGFYAGLELLVAAVQNAQELVPSDALASGLGSEAVESVCEEILTSVAKTERGRYGGLKHLAFARHKEHQEAFVWGSDDGTWNRSSSSSKAKMFMKYVAQVKAAGVPMTIPAVDRDGNIAAVCVRRIKEIQSGSADLDRVVELFEERPWLSAENLIGGFRAYLGTFIRGKKTGDSFKKERFYCTRIISVSWFVKHLDQIAKELCGDYGDRYLLLKFPP